MMRAPEEHEVVSTREAAEALGVSLRTVQLWTEAGVLDAWKTPGGHRRIYRASIDRVLEQRQPPSQASAPSSDLPTLLIVEDEPEFRTLYANAAKRWAFPCSVVAVASGFDALIQLGTLSSAVLVTDLRMPGIDGFEMIRALRTLPAAPAFSIIVATALSPAAIEAKGGLPDDVLVMSKPLDLNALRDAVQQRLAALPSARAHA